MTDFDHLYLFLGVPGGTLRLRVEGAAIARQVRADWSRSMSCTEHFDRDLHLAGPTISLPPGLQQRLVFRIGDAVIELTRSAHLLLHAAGVATDDGRVFALVAPSGTGKSTAAARLCAERFGYVTDELLVIDDEWNVLAFPKPLSLQTGSSDPPVKGCYSADELSLKHPGDRLTLAGILLLNRVDARRRATVEALDPLTAVPRVVAQAPGFTHRALPLTRLGEILRAVPVHDVEYSDASQLFDVIDGLAAQSTTPLGHDRWEAKLSHAIGPTGVRRASTSDAIGNNGQWCVLVDDVVHQLGPVASFIWEHATGIEHSHLEALIRGVFGAAPTGRLQIILDQLTANGLLEPEQI
ncbi:hypothetical protein GCM10027599_11280 [Yimella radicis]